MGDRKYPVNSSMEESAATGNKKKAEELLTTFTDNGQPGMKFRPMFEQMIKNVAHSNKALVKKFGVKKPILKEAEAPANPDGTEAENLMRYGRHRILPSFWQLLLTLIKSGRRFSIVFRSFNEEQLALFREDYEQFTIGKHPAYCGQNKTPKVPLMNGEKGSKNLQLNDMNIGKIDRKNGRLVFPKLAAIKPGQAAPEGEGAPPAAPAGDAAAEGAEAAEFEPLAYEFPEYHKAYAGIQHQILGLEGNGAQVAAMVDDVDYWNA